MIEFWITAAAMLLLGYAFFIPALAGQARAAPLSRAKLNLALHRQRQQELARETATPEDLERLTAESERNLLGDLEDTAAAAAVRPGHGRVLLLYALVSLPVFAYSAYLGLGRPDLLGRAPESRAAPAAEAGAPAMADSIRELARRLKEKPDDLEGWILLGRSLRTTGQPAQAATAFEYALKLAPDNLDLKAAYAETVADVNQGSFAGQPAAIAEEILRLDPNHQGGLWLAGIAAAQAKNPAKAAEYWGKLRAQFPPDSEDARQLGRYIAKSGANRFRRQAHRRAPPRRPPPPRRGRASTSGSR